MSTRTVQSRPLRVGAPHSIRIVPVGSIYGVRKRSSCPPTLMPIAVLPGSCEQASKWSRIVIDGARRSPHLATPSPSDMQSNDRPDMLDCVHRAVPPRRIPEKALRFEPTCSPAFQDADGVLLLNNGQTVEHHFMTPNRQAVVSTDWVHWAHDVKKRTWKVRATQAQFEYGDIFFGLTEAQAWCYDGRSLAFDVRTNFWVGVRTPADLTHKFRAKQLQSLQDVHVTGDARECGRSSTMVITAELKKGGDGRMTVQVYPEGADLAGSPVAEISYPLEGWSSARLLVSFNSPQDVVEMVA